MLFFLTFVKPFTEPALNYANMVTELGTSIFFPLICIYLFDISNSNRDKLDLILIVILNIISFSQLVASLFIASKVIYYKIKDKLDKATVHPEVEKVKSGNYEEEEEKVEILSSYLSAFRQNVSPAYSINSFSGENNPEKIWLKKNKIS